MISNFNLYITSRGKVNKFYKKNITDIVSIRDDLSLKIFIKHFPDFPLKPKVWLFLFQDDIQEGTPFGPKENDIEELIELARKFKERLSNGEKINCLIHCEAGVSRSTAAAYIILNVLADQNREIACLSEVLRLRYCAVPNDLMVKMADKVLQRDGKMFNVVQSYNKQLGIRPWSYE